MKEQPYLCIFHAWALQLSGQMEISASLLTNAENALDNLKTQDKEDLDTALGLIHSRRAYNFFIAGEHDKTVYYAKQALELLPENAVLIRLQTALYLGIAYRYQGELHSALKVYKDVLPNTQAMGNKLVSVLYSFHLGDLYTEMAQLHQAKEVYEEAIKFSERHTGHSDMPFTGYSFVSIGRILRQWNQLEDAYHFITKGIGLCRKWNFADALALSCIELAYICQALGREEQASNSIKEGSQIMDSISSWGSQIAAAHRVKLDLAHGDVAAADRWVAANDLDTDSDYESHRDLEYLALTRVFIAQKRFDEARSLAEWLYRKTKEIGRRQNELESLILLALIVFMQEDTDQALVHLESALSIGEPEGYIRIFVDEGLPMARLLYEALSCEISPEYVRRLLAAFPVEKPDQLSRTLIQTQESEWIEPLTDRELEVLQLIADGLPRQEIAAKLVLSLNTVKTHARNIFSKLGVKNQMQAVGKARGLGLLDMD